MVCRAQRGNDVPMSSPLDAISPRVLERLDAIAAQHAQLESELMDPQIQSDPNRVRELAIRKAALEDVVAGYRRFLGLCDEIIELTEAIDSGEDAEFAQLARAEIPELTERANSEFEGVKNRLVTSEDRKVGSVMLEIRAGTGGDEAGLWARDLMLVYERYAQRKRWKFEVLDLTGDPSFGGVRHAVVNVRGPGVWSELAFEAGVHSVKRVPATESQGRIHTSTATVAVLPEPEAVEIDIDWARDVQEHITTAQGPGGQNVNKVATAVHLLHTPTGIEVRMQEAKSQHQNREKARRLLLARLYELERARQHAERSAERRSQIGAGNRSEKIRVYRYQDGLVVDQRLGQKFNLQKILAGELEPMIEALIEQETARRLAEL